ncbi:unnamed protein product [marine sediment metagenome]|uniref:ACT domain-containing protein n=1 Tax=marine sediment metagenome TaxID=412755 RepID=X0YKZ0_9ZZZZ
MKLKQISVFLPNEPRQLANFFEFLMENKIYIRSITVAETEDYGLLLLLVKPFEKCVKLLEDNDYMHSVTEVIAVRLTDNISQLYNIAKTLGDNKLNIEYLYTFAEKSSEPRTMTVLRLDDNENGIEVLKKNGFDVVEDFEQ